MVALMFMLQRYAGEVRTRFESTREEGATAVEYGLMVALIAGVIVGVVALLGGTLHNVFNNTNTAINSSVGSG